MLYIFRPGLPQQLQQQLILFIHLFALSHTLSLADNLELLKKKLDMVEVHTTQPTTTLTYHLTYNESPNVNIFCY